MRDEELFNFIGKREKMIFPSDLKEKKIKLKEIPQHQLDDAINKLKKRYFGGFLGRVNPDEVKVKDSKKVDKLFWYASGTFKAAWLNKIDYPIPLNGDVEAVKIDGNIKEVRNEALKISDMLDKIGLGLSIGGIGFSKFGSVTKALGIDKTIGSRKHLLLNDVVELRKNSLEGKICISDENHKEDANKLEVIEKSCHEKTNIKHGKANTDWIIKKFFEKKMSEINNYIEKENDGIIERVFDVNDILLVSIPYYTFTLEKDGRKESVAIRLCDGKEEKI